MWLSGQSRGRNFVQVSSWTQARTKDDGHDSLTSKRKLIQTGSNGKAVNMDGHPVRDADLDFRSQLQDTIACLILVALPKGNAEDDGFGVETDDICAEASALWHCLAANAKVDTKAMELEGSVEASNPRGMAHGSMLRTSPTWVYLGHDSAWSWTSVRNRGEKVLLRRQQKRRRPSLLV